MIEGEGVIQTDPPQYNDVPDNVLELARQTGSKAWDDAIAKLSEGGSSPEDVKREIRSVTENLGNEDFKQVIGGSSGPFGDMADLLDDDYCPGGAVNNAKGKGDRKLGPGEECPNPLSDEMKDLLREYMSDSFVDLYTISKENRRDTDRYEEKEDQENENKEDKSKKTIVNNQENKTENRSYLPKGTAEENFNYALDLASQLDFENAEKAFKEFLKKHKESEKVADAQYWLGRVYFAQKKFEEAAIALAEFNSVFPNDPRFQETTLLIAESAVNFAPKDQLCDILKQSLEFMVNPSDKFVKRINILKNKKQCNTG